MGQRGGFDALPERSLEVQAFGAVRLHHVCIGDRGFKIGLETQAVGRNLVRR